MRQEGRCPPPLPSSLGRPYRTEQSKPASHTPGAEQLRLLPHVLGSPSPPHTLSACPRDPRLFQILTDYMDTEHQGPAKDV